MAKKIADQLIETLADTGIERIYAVTGDSLNEVNEAVRKNDKIPELTPQEQRHSLQVAQDVVPEAVDLDMSI